MMEGGAVVLWTAAWVAAFHTVIGVDHYVPFVALGRARRWSLPTMLGVAALCGAGHIAASAVLGAVAIGLGLGAEELVSIDTTRGAAAAWLLIGFGVAYAAWGLWRALRGRRHEHAHVHVDGTVHRHPHDHHGGHAHPHEARRLGATGTWALFVIFVLGPCETLVPLMTAPGIVHAWSTVALVVLVFGTVTVLSMLAMVVVLHAGITGARLSLAGRWGELAAGLAIVVSGLAVRFAGV